CALALFVAGLLAMALNGTHLRWGLVLPWAALAALGVFRWRLLPYFEVVAVPVLIQNLHAWFARRPNRFDAVPAVDEAVGSRDGSATATPGTDTVGPSHLPAPSHGIMTAETAATRAALPTPIDLDSTVAAEPVRQAEAPAPKSTGGFTVTLPGLAAL